MISVRRIYNLPDKKEGKWFLVDRLWPRGIKKESLAIDAWFKHIAPSNELRKQFDHNPEKWDEFKERYYAELESKEAETELNQLFDAIRTGDVTLLYSARNEEYNNAVALMEYLKAHIQE